jgi:molybdopterin converting factor small subunit
VKLTVKLFASLREGRFEIQHMDAPDGSTVRSLAVAIGIPRDEILVVFLNNRHAELEAALSEGDRLSIFPLVGGG